MTSRPAWAGSRLCHCGAAGLGRLAGSSQASNNMGALQQNRDDKKTANRFMTGTGRSIWCVDSVYSLLYTKFHWQVPTLCIGMYVHYNYLPTPVRRCDSEDNRFSRDIIIWTGDCISLVFRCTLHT